jgi:hypothetical protein
MIRPILLLLIDLSPAAAAAAAAAVVVGRNDQSCAAAVAVIDDAIDLSLVAINRSLPAAASRSVLSPLSMRSTNSLTVDTPSIDLSAAVGY